MIKKESLLGKIILTTILFIIFLFSSYFFARVLLFFNGESVGIKLLGLEGSGIIGALVGVVVSLIFGVILAVISTIVSLKAIHLSKSTKPKDNKIGWVLMVIVLTIAILPFLSFFIFNRPL